MAKNSFVLYYNYKDQLEDLTNEQIGELLRAIFDYEINGVMPEFSSAEVRIAFKFIKKDLDGNKEKYEEVCQKNRENGQKGGRPKNPVGYDKTQENPTVILETQENPIKPKKPDNDNVNDNDNDIKKKVSKAQTHENQSFDEIISDFTQYEPLRFALGEFIKMRKLIKKPLTSHSLQLCLTEHNKGLFDLAGGDHDLATQIVNQSIRNSWQGLFPLRENNTNQTVTENAFLNIAMQSEVVG